MERDREDLQVLHRSGERNSGSYKGLREMSSCPRPHRRGDNNIPIAEKPNAPRNGTLKKMTTLVTKTHLINGGAHKVCVIPLLQNCDDDPPWRSVVPLSGSL